MAWRQEPADPQAEETFAASKLDRSLRHQGRHQTLWRYYAELLRLRRETPALRQRSRDRSQVSFNEDEKTLLSWSQFDETEALLVLACGERSLTLDAARMLGKPSGAWLKRFDSTAQQWQESERKPAASVSPAADIWSPGEPLALRPHSAVLYVREE